MRNMLSNMKESRREQKKIKEVKLLNIETEDEQGQKMKK